MVNDHYIHVCSCGAVINQCRCIGDKVKTVIPNGCDKCKDMKEEYTVEYFNNLLEAMMKGTKERCYRRVRLMPGETLGPTDSSPEGSMIHGLQRDVDNSPMKTPRGKASVKRQARKNQMHPERFAEATEFIQKNIGNFAALGALDEVNDKIRLKMLVQRLIPRAKNVQREWLNNLCKVL